MKYFEVTMSSEHYCGFETTRYFEAESEDKLRDNGDMFEFDMDMFEYISGHCDEDDYEMHEEPAARLISVEETTKEVYEERKTWGDCG